MNLLRQSVSGHNGRGKARCSADAERPARAGMVGDPTYDWRANWRAPERDAETERHHLSSRMAGSVESCIRVLVALVKVKAAMPMTTSAPANSQ